MSGHELHDEWVPGERPAAHDTPRARRDRFAAYIATLPEAESWGHCGDEREHSAHRHPVVTNEGAHPGTCVGTPELPARVETAADEVRAHLRDAHRNEAALDLSDVVALARHYEEHCGPGGPRNHDAPEHLHNWPALIVAEGEQPDLTELLENVFVDAQRKTDEAVTTALALEARLTAARGGVL